MSKTIIFKIVFYIILRGRSYIARYALGEGGGQPVYRKTTAGGGGGQQKYRISHEKETSD